MTEARKPSYPGAYGGPPRVSQTAPTEKSLKRVVDPEDAHLEQVVTRIVKEQLPDAIADVLPGAIEKALAPVAERLEKSANFLIAQSQSAAKETTAAIAAATMPAMPMRGQMNTGEYHLEVAKAALAGAGQAVSEARAVQAQQAATSVDFERKLKEAQLEGELARADIWKRIAKDGRLVPAVVGLLIGALSFAGNYLASRQTAQDIPKQTAAAVVHDLTDSGAP